MKQPRKPLSAPDEARRQHRLQERKWQREEEAEWAAAHRESMRHVDNCLCAAVQHRHTADGLTCFQKISHNSTAAVKVKRKDS